MKYHKDAVHSNTDILASDASVFRLHRFNKMCKKYPTGSDQRSVP